MDKIKKKGAELNRTYNVVRVRSYFQEPRLSEGTQKNYECKEECLSVLTDLIILKHLS
jgi:hypothetical protein